MLAICSFMDDGLKQQAEFNLHALERAIGWPLEDEHRTLLIEQQHQALRWTYLGSGMRHEKFRATVGELSPLELKHIDALAPKFS